MKGTTCKDQQNVELRNFGNFEKKLRNFRATIPICKGVALAEEGRKTVIGHTESSSEGGRILINFSTRSGVNCSSKVHSYKLFFPMGMSPSN